MNKLLTVVGCIILLSGCADTVTFERAMFEQPVGFWYGLWHGCIIPFSWLFSLFLDDISIYAIYNNGGWYDFGFFCGVGGFSGVGFIKN